MQADRLSSMKLKFSRTSYETMKVLLAMWPGGTDAGCFL